MFDCSQHVPRNPESSQDTHSNGGSFRSQESKGDGHSDHRIYNKIHSPYNFSGLYYDPKPEILIHDQKTCQKGNANQTDEPECCRKSKYTLKPKKFVESKIPALLLDTIEAAKKNKIQYLVKNSERYNRREAGFLSNGDELGNTPLYYAVQRRHLEIVEWLIQFGVDVNRRCQFGNTALHYAMMVGDKIDKNIPILQTLITAGANPKILNDFN